MRKIGRYWSKGTNSQLGVGSGALMYSTATILRNTVVIYLKVITTVYLKCSHQIHKKGNYEVTNPTMVVILQ